MQLHEAGILVEKIGPRPLPAEAQLPRTIHRSDIKVKKTGLVDKDEDASYHVPQLPGGFVTHTKTLIVGAGLAGMSTALHLDGADSVILEAAPHAGGLCTTRRVDDYGFDATGHWLHMRDAEVRGRLAAAVPMMEVERRSKIFAHDRLVAYPYQSNLKDVPHDIRVECLMGAIEAHVRRSTGAPEPRGFADYVLHHFGEGIARHFMFPYNSKLWGVDPAAISHAWCQRFVPVPDLKQVVEGALSRANEADGYNAAFSYPTTGGIGEFSAAVARQVPRIECGERVVRVHTGEKWVQTDSGHEYHYENLVSTMPLKTLVEATEDAPEEVRAAGAELKCASTTFLDLGLNRKVLQGLHWVYLPDPKLATYRLGCYSNAAPHMAPEGCSSLYVEFANDREVNPREALGPVLAAISALGEPVGEENVDVLDVRTIEFAYVIYDQSYAAARKTALDFYASRGVQSIGRYGKWVYSSMEDALIDGRVAAARAGSGII
jgi:protoporphyrinogen oxidase